MSHELRTPMNAILGMTDLALRRTTDARQRDQLDKVVHASQHLLSVINDILDLSRSRPAAGARKNGFPAGRGDRQPAQHGRRQGGRKRPRPDIDIAPELAAVAVSGDPLRLGQILLNLTGNAIKFTSAGSVQVAVTAQTQPGNRLALRFTVRDTGIGIPESDRLRIFSLRPGRCVDHAPVRRQRPGAGDQPQAGAHDGWRHHRRQHARGGQHLLPHRLS
jgi:signal transduction histidine kinase